MKIIGIRFCDIVTEDGKNIKGQTLYCSVPITSDKGLGEFPLKDKFFVSERIISESLPFSVGDEIEILFNHYGKVQKVNIL